MNKSSLTPFNETFDALNVTGVLEGKLPDVNQAGMAYPYAEVRGTIQGMKITADEFALNAKNVTVTAQGSIDFATDRIDGTVLAAPLPTVNWIVSKIPILGNILGTTVLAIPVQISGKLDSPIVVPLGPQAVAVRFKDILSNTLRLPIELNRVTPRGDHASGLAPEPPQ